MRNERTTSIWLMITVVLLMTSGIVNLMLARKVTRLNNSISLLKAEASIKENAQVQPIVAQDLIGQPTTISYNTSSLPTLLYIFKPSCGWCKKNELSINALAKQSAGKVRLVALSLSNEQLAEYINSWKPTFPIYTNLTSATISAYKLGSTPSTLLIAPDGKVLKVWTGAYTGEIQHQIEDYFKVTLPAIN